MHILIGIVLGVALLYFWLCGGWFPRILVGLALGAFFFVFSVGFEPHGPNPGAGVGILRLTLSPAAAWVICSIPTWYWRQRMRTIAEAEMRSLRPAG